MWRREAWLLRVGREQVELWSGSPGRLVREAVQPLGAMATEGPQAGALSAALAGLWPQVALPGPGGRRGRVAVIVESAWMPVLLLSTGALWRSADTMALARHRLGEVHGPSAASWEVRVDHRPGDAHGLAFGVPSDVLAALRTACEAVRLDPGGVQPALAWGFNATRALVPTRRAGWWLWPEQDRHLLAHVDRGGITSLNPALPATLAATGRAGIAQVVEIERQRQGERDDGLDVVAGTWTTPRAQDASLPLIRWARLMGGTA